MEMGIRQFQKLCLQEYTQNAYLNQWEEFNYKCSITADLAELGLINTEIAEGQEAIRDNDYKALEFELADIIIRTFNFASRKGFDMQKILIDKLDFNFTRDKLHGRVNI